MKDVIKNINSSDYFKKANLHCHSNYSDGFCDFDKLIEEAHNLGLEYFSICDHNTIEGYRNSKYKDDPILITGVEFDCFLGLCYFHLLGYGMDINHPEFQKICAKHKIETQKNPLRVIFSKHPKRAIEAIHSAGGVAVLAHPCCCLTFNLEKFVKKLVGYGLDGMEIYYPYNRHRGIVKFHSKIRAKEIAQKYDLIMTGGCDNHKSLQAF